MRKISLTAIAVLLLLTTYGQSDKLKFQNTIEITSDDNEQSIIAKAAHVIPTANQLRALKEEFIAFIHLGPNSFTMKEWGDGYENPSVFDLKTLDTDQWCETMRAAGMKMVLITAKHHDGFVLWQSRYTSHGIMSTGFSNGKGDILRDLSTSCAKYGLKLGIYLSPADLFQIESPDGLYGNLSKPSLRTIPRKVEGKPFKNKTTFEFCVDDYNEYFLNQLFEVLTEYGQIHEVWFDGAHPKTKGGQTYNYAAWKELIHKLAPKAVIFGREDIRWCGNESGDTRKTEWNVIPYYENPNTASRFADMTADDLGDAKRLLDAKYLHYQQAETNTSIREGWFYRDDTHQGVRSTDDVFDIYERSVGGNSTFLLNIPPNREGRFSPRDVEVLKEVGQRIKMTYDTDLFAGAKKNKVSDNEVILKSGKPVKINRVILGEDIGNSGERVASHALDAWVDGRWIEVAAATNIGYKRILRFADVTTDRLRVRILDSRLTPTLSKISAHYYRSRPPQLSILRDNDGMVVIEPAFADFGWKAHGENAVQNINLGLKIYFTTDGTIPNVNTGKHYTEPFNIERGQVRAIAVIGDEQGVVSSETVGYVKKGLKVDAKQGLVVVDFDVVKPFSGFAYMPTSQEIMTVSGVFESSEDGNEWKVIENFEFGNLQNDPSLRRLYFKTPVEARFLRIKSNVNITIDNLQFY